MEIIGSIKDERIVLARALTSRRGRDEYSRMLLHGEQILDWAIQAGIEIEFILIASSAPTDLIE